MDNLWQSHVGRGWTILASHTVCVYVYTDRQWDDGLPLAITCSEMDNLCRSHAVRWTIFASHMQWDGQPLPVTCSEMDNLCRSHAVRWTTFASHLQWEDGLYLPSVRCNEKMGNLCQSHAFSTDNLCQLHEKMDSLCQSYAVRRLTTFISHMQWKDGQRLVCNSQQKQNGNLWQSHTMKKLTFLSPLIYNAKWMSNFATPY